MDWLIKLASKVSGRVFLIALIIFVAFVIYLIKITFKYRKDIKSAIDSWSKREQEREDVKQATMDNTEAIKALQQKNEEFCYNRIHDREQSFEIQRQLTDAISELSKKIYDMEERQKEVKRAEIKDKIAERYRYFHKKQKWTLKDKESLEGLIKAYEKNDGQNSFVHSDVEPEMYTWEIVNDDYDD